MEQRLPDDAVADAIDRVLAAEIEAAAAIGSAQAKAEALIEAARGRRRQILDSARRRASLMHARAQSALQKALDELEDQGAGPRADMGRLHERSHQALENLARRLSSIDHESN